MKIFGVEGDFIEGSEGSTQDLHFNNAAMLEVHNSPLLSSFSCLSDVVDRFEYCPRNLRASTQALGGTGRVEEGFAHTI